MDTTTTATPTPVRKRKLQARFFESREKAEPELIYPRVAAVELLPDFRALAKQMAPRDPSTQDDLVQEMALAALLLHEPQTRSTYRLLAVWRASNYLHWWRFPMFTAGDKRSKKERIVLPDLSLDEADERAAHKLTSPEIEHACEQLNLLLNGTREPAA